MTTKKPVPENIVERIRKMLNLAANEAAEPGEAANAARMAEALMRKYNIEQAELIVGEIKQGQGIVSEFAVDDWDHASNRYPLWMSTIAVQVAFLFDCHAQLKFTGNYTGSKRCANIVFYGYREDVGVAKWTFSYLIHRINALADQHWESEQWRYPSSQAKIVKRSYRDGAAMTLYARISKMIEAKKNADRQDSTCTSLVLVKEDAIKKAFPDIDFEYVKAEKRDVVDSAFRSGREDAKSISINRPIESPKENAKRLST